jgi:small GTP-binding protein
MNTPDAHPRARAPVVRLCLLGETGVGKTQLARRLENRGSYIAGGNPATIGVDFRSAYLAVGPDKSPVKVDVWDTAGQERFDALTTSYLRKVDGVVLVFDVTSRVSYDGGKTRWLKKIRDITPPPQVMLIGNKSDLRDAREVGTGEAGSFAELEGLYYYEMSAETGDGVVTAFCAFVYDMCVARSLVRAPERREKPPIILGALPEVGQDPAKAELLARSAPTTCDC